VQATYYNGRSAASQTVSVHLHSGGLSLLRGEEQLHWPFGALRVAERLADCPAVVELPGGARLEVPDAQSFYAALATHSAPRRNWRSALEGRAALVAVALLLSAAVIAFAVFRGAPELARRAAAALPPETEAAMARRGLRALDATLFSPSELSAARQAQLQRIFSDVIGAVPANTRARLEFRRSEALGPNAFALPGGVIVITDALVELARHDEEIAAVLAHEAGHLVHRHALRGLLQGSIAAGLIIAVTGDIGSAANLAATLPVLLLNLSYSRDFEREADNFAFSYLAARGIAPTRLADLLLRMEREHGAHTGRVSFLSTHPSGEERLAEARRRSANP